LTLLAVDEFGTLVQELGAGGGELGERGRRRRAEDGGTVAVLER
jgi:hypothetical protein